MSWILVIVRVVVALPFLVFGLNYFLNFMPMPPEFPTSEAKSFMDAVYPTNYLAVVKVLEILGAILLLTGRAAPLGLTILVPITVNIALWDALLVRFATPPLGVILLVLELFLIWKYRAYFASVWTPNARLA